MKNYLLLCVVFHPKWKHFWSTESRRYLSLNNAPNFLNFWPLKIIRGHSKTIETCCTCREEHAGRCNFALSPPEAKLSAVTGFRHFSSLDLTSEVTGWPGTLSLYTNLFVSRRATRSFFPRSSSSIRGETARGSYQPPLLCRGRMRNGLCRRGLMEGASILIPVVYMYLDIHISCMSWHTCILIYAWWSWKIKVKNWRQVNVITSGARSAERVYFYIPEKSQYERPAGRPWSRSLNAYFSGTGWPIHEWSS